MNNEEKNTYVKEQIVNTLIKLMDEQDFSNISISQITTTAQVSRNSFYRNYTDKEDILVDYIRFLITNWNTEYQKQSNGSNADLYGSLFKHLKINSSFYLLLKKQNLFHLLLKILLELFGPKPELDNMWAYTTSFITYGTFGWIEEWIGRGMQESAETMAALLAANGMK